VTAPLPAAPGAQSTARCRRAARQRRGGRRQGRRDPAAQTPPAASAPAAIHQGVARWRRCCRIMADRQGPLVGEACCCGSLGCSKLPCTVPNEQACILAAVVVQHEHEVVWWCIVCAQCAPGCNSVKMLGKRLPACTNAGCTTTHGHQHTCAPAGTYRTKPSSTGTKASPVHVVYR
jgi:hypothetical protein